MFKFRLAILFFVLFLTSKVFTASEHDFPKKGSIVGVELCGVVDEHGKWSMYEHFTGIHYGIVLETKDGGVEPFSCRVNLLNCGGVGWYRLDKLKLIAVGVDLSPFLRVQITDR